MPLSAVSRRHLLGITALTLVLSGCELGPNFSPPRAAVPAAYISDAPAAAAAPYVSGDPVDPAWWNSFKDPELTKLETLAVAQNLDLQIATERLLEAEAQAQITGAALYPNLSFAGSYTREGPSKEGIFNAFGSAASASTAASSVASGATGAAGGGAFSGATIAPLDIYQYGLQSMYDLDLWGKNRRAVEASIAAARASEEARRAALLNVETQVASNYVQLRGTETILGITQRNLGLANQLVDLTVERENAGLTTALDVANARATSAEISSQIPTLIAQRDAEIGQIGLLLGVTPETLPAELVTAAPVPLTPPTIPVGLPSDLLRRRPDIREAEQSLHEATAETGVAIASFFPDLSLSGSVSLQSLQFKDLNEFKAITYAFGPQLTLPLFEGGQLHGQLSLRQAEQREAAISYAKTVLAAFYQVDVALVTYTQEHATLAALNTDMQQSQIALGLAEDQYKQGLADYLSVLDAQQSYLQAQQSQAQAVATLSGDLVSLYQALGGGWQGTFPEPDLNSAPSPVTTVQVATAVPAATPESADTASTSVAATIPAVATPAAATLPAAAPLPTPLQR